jgi:N6-L-threonylcarbamoyladenine synthase
MILAIETSCDDTCAAVVTRDGEIRSNVVSSQGVHDRFGGVVPEIASRHHLELVNAVVDDALHTAGTSLGEVDSVAVTQGPGLVGALLVGVATAKALAAARGLPLVPVDHLDGHVAANYLQPDPFDPPFICLIASGGHTMVTHVTDHRGYELIGETLDDAAARRSTRARGCSAAATPAGPRSRSWRRAATRRPSTSRPAPASTASTSASPGSRRRCSTRSAISAPSEPPSARRTSRRATSTPSSRR